ncbi:MAG: phosphatase PAP2 family protein [Bacillota bacterium]
MIKRFDQKIFLSIYNYTQRHKLLKKSAIFSSKLGAKLFSIIYFLTAVQLFYQANPQIRTFILVPAAVYLLLKLIPVFYNRQRPFVELEIKKLIKQRQDHSFPSNHAASSLVIALVFLEINFVLGFWLILVSILISFSRIMLGVHYPSDILAAWILAFSIYGGGLLLTVS